MINPAIFAAMSAQVTITVFDSVQNKYIVSLSKTDVASAHVSIAEIDVGAVSPNVYAFDLTNITFEDEALEGDGPWLMFQPVHFDMLLGNVTMTIDITHALFNPDKQIFASTTAAEMANLKNWIGASGFPSGG